MRSSLILFLLLLISSFVSFKGLAYYSEFDPENPLSISSEESDLTDELSEMRRILPQITSSEAQELLKMDGVWVLTELISAFPELAVLPYPQLKREFQSFYRDLNGYSIPLVVFQKMSEIYPHQPLAFYKNKLLQLGSLGANYPVFETLFRGLTVENFGKLGRLASDQSLILDLKRSYSDLNLEQLIELARALSEYSMEEINIVIQLMKKMKENEPEIAFLTAAQNAIKTMKERNGIENFHFNRAKGEENEGKEKSFSHLEKQNILLVKRYFPELKFENISLVKEAPLDERALDEVREWISPEEMTQDEFAKEVIQIAQHKNRMALSSLIETLIQVSKKKLNSKFIMDLLDLDSDKVRVLLKLTRRPLGKLTSLLEYEKNLDYLIWLYEKNGDSPEFWSQAGEKRELENYQDALQNNCPIFDLRSEFPLTLRNQEQQGTCWAFAAAELLSQKACQRDASFCGKMFSVSDITRSKRNLNSEDMSGKVPDSLNYSIKNGICLEKESSYIGIQTIYENLRKYFEKQSRNVAARFEVTSEIQRFSEKISEAEPIAHMIQSEEGVSLGRGVSALRMALAAQRSDTFSEFIYRISLPVSCSYNRVGKDIYPQILSNLRPMSHYTQGESHVKTLEFLKKSLFNHSAFSLRICANRARKRSGHCGSHAILLTAVKKDEKTGECMGFLRNSWGNTEILNGWKKLTDILNHTQEINFLSSSN